MRCRAVMLSIASGLALVAACGEGLGPLDPLTELPRTLTVSEELLVDADNRFATKLFQAVVGSADPNQNIFISPLSTGMALGMTYNGAVGETQAAMQEALQLNGMSIEQVNEAYHSLIELLRGLDQTVVFRLANSIWYQPGPSVVQEFLDVNQQYFDAEVAEVDFGSASTKARINEWVDSNTDGKIREIVDEIDPNTIMFLINAIYFNGAWTYQFNKGLTRDAAFHLSGGDARIVHMMSRDDEAEIQFYRGERFQAIDLPYGAQAFSMTVLLPDEDWHVDSLIAQLTDETWRDVVDGLNRRQVIVEMPKFRLEYDLEMRGVLAALGMDIAFTPAADFSNLYVSGAPTYISTVKHKTFVEVDEEGTEAAAVTAVGVVSVCACGPTVLRIDRPFVFVIRERFSNTTLFVGRMIDPTQESSSM